MKVTHILSIFGGALVGNAQTIDLGTAAQFGALGPAGVTNTGLTVVNGDVGTTGTSITGFPPGITTGSLVFGDAAAQAQADSEAAYIQGQSLPFTVDYAGLAELGGLILTPGVYNFDAAVTLNGILTLSGPGTYVFQLGSTITTAGGSTVLLTNGATPCNVFWIVGTAATIGTTTIFEGNILAGTAITFNTGATNSGGLYAGSAVTLDTNVIMSCESGPIPTVTSSSTTAPVTITSSTSSSSSVEPPSTTSSAPLTSTSSLSSSSSAVPPSTTSSTSSLSSSSSVLPPSTTSSITSAPGSTTTKKASTTSTTKKTSTIWTTKKTSSTTTKKTSTSSTKKPTTTLKTSTTKKATKTTSSAKPTATSKKCPKALVDPIGYILCILAGGHP